MTRGQRTGKVLLLFTILLLLLGSIAIQAQEPIERQLIRLQVATFDPLVDGEPVVNLEVQSPQKGGPYYLVQFADSIDAVSVQQVEQLGAELLGYVPDNTHLARIRAEDVDKIRSLSAVRWVGPYRSDYKLAPGLSTSRMGVADTQIEVYVVGFPGESLADLESFLRGWGATVEDTAKSEIGIFFRIRIAASALPAIVQHPAISWVEPFTPIQTANQEGRRVINVENVWQNNGYFGNGQIVAVSDSGLSDQNSLSLDFAGRLKRAFAPSELALNPACTSKTNWTDQHGHGTHVAGSVLGSGTNSGSNAAAHNYTNSFAGSAPEAQLVFMALSGSGGGMECISTNGSFLAKGYDQGARISSNSWGGFDPNNPTANRYDVLTSIVDNYIWSHKDYLVLYAAHNHGDYDRNGVVNPQTIASPAGAKNVLTVGAAENNRPSLGQSNADNPDEMAIFSSRGPTYDGRVKPEVVAPGTFILSVKAPYAPAEHFWAPYNNDYAYMGGTSMATPLAAGGATLVREWVNKARSMPNPSAALLKALLIHGALQLPGATTPNLDSGWGRVDLKNTLNAEYVIFDDHQQGLIEGQQVTYTVNVVGASSAGILVDTGDTYPAPDTLDLQQAATDPVTPTATTSGSPGFALRPLPGFDQPQTFSAPDGVPSISSGEPSGSFVPRESLHDGGIAPASYWLNVIGGGDFDTNWETVWQYYWLGTGLPARYDYGGNYYMSLGGDGSDVALWYPLSFPPSLDTTYDSYLQFNFQLNSFDTGYDAFCFGLLNVAGEWIGPDLGNTGSASPLCLDGSVDEGILDGYAYTYPPTPDPFTSAELSDLAGETGYLVFYVSGDGVSPHTYAYVDDVVLALDFPDVTLSAVPSSGPPGTEFLMTGHNLTPYNYVDFYQDGAPLGYAYADARGDVVVTLDSTGETAGTFTIRIEDRGASRWATTPIMVTSGGTPSLSRSPASGRPGTTFALDGSNFVPNDNNISVLVNGGSIGSVASDINGTINFTITTNSNTPVGTYNVSATDSGGYNASTTFEVTAAPGGTPVMVVTPTIGAAGTSFVFSGSNFAASVTVTLSLDGQPSGQIATDASGTFQATLITEADAAPAKYVLHAADGTRQASVQFEIVGEESGTTPQTGSGLYLTLVWTDPPAQAGALSALVNDLNLRVVGPGGVYYGNGGTAADTKNNVETVRLETPPAGSYTIIVQAQRVVATYGSQPYALVGTAGQSFGGNTNSIYPGSKVYLPTVLRNASK